MECQGKVAVITGGTRGIGAAAAMALAQRGADLALVGRNLDDEARDTQRRIEALGSRCALIAADVAVPEQAARCISAAAEQLGRVDILVHCAGGPAGGSLLQVAAETWYEAFDVHVHAAFHLCRAVVPLIQKQGEGAIVLISSVAGIRGVLNNITYSTVKGAVLQLTRALARDLAGDNIRVNCVAPGIIRTRFHASMTPETYKNNVENRIPLHREGTPDEVGEAIALLVTNGYITGECLVVDGGLTSRIA